MYNEQLYNWIELEYAGLVEGQTMSGQTCPSCKQRGVMSVSRINKQLLWLCHRASCGFRRGKAYAGFVPAPPKENEREVIYPVPEPLTDAVYKYLAENYGLSKGSINRAKMGFLPDYKGGDRLYMPIFTQAGQVAGYSAKALDRTVQPKVLNQTSFPSLVAWYPNTTKTRKILVVEDQLSAIRASEHLTAVSILGTHLNTVRVEELLSFKPEEILLALDADAFDKAVKYVVQFKGLTGGKMKVVKINKDVKNMPTDMFKKFIDGII